MAKRKKQRQAAERELAAAEQRRRRIVLLAAVLITPIAIALLGVVAWQTWHERTGFTDLVDAGQPALADVYRGEDHGREHVPRGTPVSRDERFPLSGTHWPTWVDPGFHTEPQERGELIHSLEHGLIVIYYDELTPEAEQQIRAWTRRFSGDWSGVLAVPHTGLGSRLVVTAWRHRLDLNEFEPAAMAAFIDAYRGRGPENPVR